MKWYLSLFLTATSVCVMLEVSQACNEAICASLVSKCLLIKSCECDMSDVKNCSCCKDCQVCLAKLYTECCSCVGLCPVPSPDDSLTKSSSIEELTDPIPDLFKVLTEEDDPLKRWTTFTYPALPNVPSHVYKTDTVTGEFGIAMNCTVAFFSQCMSVRRCKMSCKSMGAARYRWFHEYGCCQCVGSTCLDYGLQEPQCLSCPPNNDISEDELSIDTSEPGNDIITSMKEEIKVGGKAGGSW